MQSFARGLASGDNICVTRGFAVEQLRGEWGHHLTCFAARLESIATSAFHQEVSPKLQVSSWVIASAPASEVNGL